MHLIRSALLTVALVFGLAACHSPEDLRSEPEQLIDNAAATAKSMYADPNYASMLNLTNRARAVFIMPSMLRAGFIWGVRTGNGVMIARDESGQWSSPAFYTLGGVNWGLQAGLQDQEIIIVIMTERGMNAIVNRKVNLGADASVAAGELGKGYSAATGIGLNADMYTFAKSSGLYAGISLEGSWIEQRDSWNKMMYGDAATPQAILVDRTFSAPQAQVLISSMP